MYRLYRQNGFIYPLTLTICILLPFFIVTEIELYKTELLFLEEQEELLQLQSIAQLGLGEISTSLVNTPVSVPISGILFFPIGKMDYSITMYDSDSYLIQAKATSLKNRQYIFKVVIHIEDKIVERWIEG